MVFYLVRVLFISYLNASIPNHFVIGISALLYSYRSASTGFLVAAFQLCHHLFIQKRYLYRNLQKISAILKTQTFQLSKHYTLGVHFFTIPPVFISFFLFASLSKATRLNISLIRADPVAINGFQLRSGKIGRQVDQHAFGNKQVLTGQQDFRHHIARYPKILLNLVYSQVVKTPTLWYNSTVQVSNRAPAVSGNQRIAALFKRKTDFPGYLAPVLLIRWKKSNWLRSLALIFCTDRPN